MSSPQYRCTVTGPTGAPACTNLSITKDSTITLSTTTPAASGGSAATPNQWTFNVTNATTDSQSISQVRCGPTAGVASTSSGTRTLNSASSTGTSYSNYLAQTLATNLTNNSYDGTVGPNSFRGTNNTFTASGNTVNATISRWSDGSGGAACPGGSLTITKTGSTMTVGAVTQHHDNLYDGTTRYYYTFTISNITAANESINQIECSGATSQTTLTGPASTGTSNPSQLIQRLESLRTGLDGQSRNSFTYSCPTAATASGFACTITGPSTCTSPTLYFQGGSSSTGIYIGGTQLTSSGNFGSFTAGTSATSPTFTFDIQNATTASKTISAISCGGTSILPSPAPSTGTDSTSTIQQRINNLTGATAPSTAGNIGPTNGYTLSCQPATASGGACTLTGPAGVAACTDTGTGDFVINKDSSISVGTVTRTSAGSAGGVQTENFAPYLSTVSPFSGGYTVQGTSTTSIVTLTTTPTAPSPITFSSGSSASTLAINTNTAGGSGGLRLNLSGGADPDVSANHWTSVGVFKRTDIVPGNNAYSRGSGRTDCAGATCTYTEELQNFANWYTYYRTRMQMMKSASTLAFSGLDSNYRIGFDNICQATGTSVKLGAAQFGNSGVEVANQRTNWWSQLTSASPSCATPLRAETAKIGRYYAGKLSGTDPLQYSCQQNFMILVTDGYWNESEPSATSVLGTDIGNVDNNSTTAPAPYYDGQQASTTCPGTGSTRSTASSCRTLADIAWYYYSTDLRDSSFTNKCNGGLGNGCTTGSANDVSTNNVLTSADDKNQTQHMVFYAMGLGIDGTLNYRSDYQTAGIGDFANIRAGTLNWPSVLNLDQTGVDDLWHATANGHGKYFSARNLPSVVTGLREALTKIGSRVGSAAAAATSNLEPVAGDNFAYVASYATVDWTGDVQSRSINVTTGDVSPDTNCSTSGSGCQWSAQTKLDNMTWSARRIYMAPSSNASGDPLLAFTWNNLSGTQQGYFNPSSLSQYSTLSVSNPGDITAQNLVDFLRGNRHLEQDGDLTHPQIWRLRAHVLGDIVDTQPVYSRSPNRTYLDAGYKTFTQVGTGAARRPVVFIASQDGMLHAISADTANVSLGGAIVAPGEELWSYIPKQAMANMKVLADVNYTLNHRYFIDGPIMVADVDFGAPSLSPDWHTILVAGQGGGGTSYFALDVTDPLNPAFLWEISPGSTGFANLGYTFSNPTAAKLPNGEWAVFFTSGYNNANGQGYLYAVNPQTGAMKNGFPMGTGSGNPSAPSNLGKIGVFVTNPATDNTAQYVYAGGTDGDLWRFDLAPTASGHSGTDVFKLAHLANGSGVAQPITTKPEMTIDAGGHQLIFVGTGKYLEIADLSDNTVQSFYAIKDTLGTANLGGTGQQTWDPRTDVSPSNSSVKMFLPRKLIETKEDGTAITQTANGVTNTYRMICRGTSSTVTALGACNNEDTTALDLDTYGGWYVDFPDTGERMNVNMNLTQGTLTFATNIPGASSCTVGGSSWLNFLDYSTGLAVTGQTYVSIKITDSLVVGITVIKVGTQVVSDPSGSGSSTTTAPTFKVIATKSNYQTQTATVPTTAAPGTPVTSPFQNKRGLWREFEPY
ncbi:MAG: hypothetical protein EKK46_04455 [Rhodocyclaceae bacterium]|nr:MAG: hypothetical protein EKK46_04455 [Rhodocyclaceae bacterium]